MWHKGRCQSLSIIVVALAAITMMIIPIRGYEQAGASTTTPNLMADSGQYVPIAPTKILDTGTGTGEANNVAADLSPNSSVVNVPVLGVGAIPTSGVSAVFVNVEEIFSTASGYVSMYQSGISDPRKAVVSFPASVASSGSGIVMVTPQSLANSGTIAFSNNGNSTTRLAAFVEGYFTDGSQSDGFGAGSSYEGTVQTNLVDTRTGIGAPLAKIPAGGSITFSVIPSPNLNNTTLSDVAAADLEIGALNETNTGLVKVSGAYSQPTVRNLSYTTGVKVRVGDLAVPDANGNVTITNIGPGSTDVQVILRGYFIRPTSAIAGASYVGLDPATVCDTRVGCAYSGVNYATVAANSSITIQETGIAGIPTTDVYAVANEINALNPTASGYLTVDPAGTTLPTTLAADNFTANVNGEDVTFENSIVSATSSSGASVTTARRDSAFMGIFSNSACFITTGAPH